jgi:hypothetical protein
MLEPFVSRPLQPSPLVGEGGAKRRMRGLVQHVIRSTEPLSHHCVPQWSPLSLKGRGLNIIVDGAHHA